MAAVSLLQRYSKSDQRQIGAISRVRATTELRAPDGNRNGRRVPKRVVRLAEENVRELIEAYQQGDSTYALDRRMRSEGASLRQIAEILEVSQSTVSRALG